MKDDHLDTENKIKIDLFQAFSLVDTVEEVQNFLIDLCTPSEIKAFKERWEVCQLLNEKKYSYREINKMTGASLTTIGRVARFLNEEKYGGYRAILAKRSLFSKRE